MNYSIKYQVLTHSSVPDLDAYCPVCQAKMTKTSFCLSGSDQQKVTITVWKMTTMRTTNDIVAEAQSSKAMKMSFKFWRSVESHLHSGTVPLLTWILWRSHLIGVVEGQNSFLLEKGDVHKPHYIVWGPGHTKSNCSKESVCREWFVLERIIQDVLHTSDHSYQSNGFS